MRVWVHEAGNDCDVAEILVRGTGPALLLLHAFPLNRTMWEPQVSALVADCRCIPIDPRGFGESRAAPPYSMDRYVDELLAVYRRHLLPAARLRAA